MSPDNPLFSLGQGLAEAIVSSLKIQLQEMPLPSLGRSAYSEEALAEELGVKPSTLSTWRSEGRGPKYLRIGKTVIYPVKSVLTWLDEGTLHASTAHEAVSR